MKKLGDAKRRFGPDTNVLFAGSIQRSPCVTTDRQGGEVVSEVLSDGKWVNIVQSWSLRRSDTTPRQVRLSRSSRTEPTQTAWLEAAKGDSNERYQSEGMSLWRPPTVITVCTQVDESRACCVVMRTCFLSQIGVFTMSIRQQSSKDRNDTWRTSNTTLDPQRCTRQKETPSAFLLTHPPQLLQIPQLSNRCPPHY